MTVFHIYANDVNIGDVLAAAGIRVLLEKQRPGLHIVRLWCDRPYIAQTIGTLRRMYTPGDLVIIGGGGLFMRYFTPFWLAFVDLNTILGMQYLLWGVGYCSHVSGADTRADYSLLTQVVDNSLMAAVRDDISFRPFERTGKCLLTGCPALVAVRRLRFDTKRDMLMYAHHPDLVSPAELSEVCRLLGADCTFGRRRTLVTTNIVADPSGIDHLLSETYASAALIVSSRLHGLIVGVGLGTKVIALVRDEKLSAFMRLVGLEHWCCQAVTDLPDLLRDVHVQTSVEKTVEAYLQLNDSVSRQIGGLLC